MKPDLFQTRRLQQAAAEMKVTLDMAQPLAGDGSDRRFYRLLGSPTVVLLWHPGAPGGEVNENDSYYLIGSHLRKQGVPVPEIFTYCREEGWMLIEDLGDVSLQVAVKGRAQPAQMNYWYQQALEVLVRLQLGGAVGFDPAWCFDTPALNREFLLGRECGYFVQAFLNRYLGLKVEMEELAPDFERLTAGAVPVEGPYFLHRDFQSRNLFIKVGRLRVIDFQGARLGPLGYDLAALLIDPYVNLSPEQQEEFLEYYLGLLAERLPMDPTAFREQYYHLALCRNLQVLGAFAFLTKVKGKDYFARFIPTAVAGLRRRLAERPGEFPHLEAVAARL